MPIFSVPDNYAFDNYSDLVAAVGDWMDRSDLEGSAQQMIALAEARMRRELAPLFLEKSDTLTTVDGKAELPADYSTLVRVMYNGSVLPQHSVRALATVAEGSQPLAYSIEADQLRLWPAGDWVVDILYHPTIPFLTEASPTNELLSKHPDAYFLGAMFFAEGFVSNDGRAGNFKALWDECLDEMKVFLTRQKFGGPLVPRMGCVP